MTALLCLRSFKTIQLGFITGSRSYNVGRASSITSAIAKVLRKSNGAGFIGKADYDPKDPRAIYKALFGLPEYETKKKPAWLEEKKAKEKALKSSGRLAEELQRRGWNSETNPGPSSTIPSSSSFGRRGRIGRSSRDSKQSVKEVTKVIRKIYERKPRQQTIESRAEQRKYNAGMSIEKTEYAFDSHSASKTERPNESNNSTSNPKELPLVIKKIAVSGDPISIPYTTPASEFLYGTSVVEAALKSQREPRRQLYKLYIYTGENRVSTERDAEFERLAKDQNIAVQHVGSNWQIVLNKICSGRPHNGYVLEASPLPKLPVTKLGAFTSTEEQNGFSISLDYQSKEEVAVNGTSDFIHVAKNFYKRKPLVLFLDSILDPQNLGGIIRTASFLGVSCIAISTRNCAPFSHVVLKASAGASENMNILSVKNPESFIQESKAAGWKIYAAVPPANTGDVPELVARKFRKIPSVSTDQLSDPLAQAPSILMLGSEGEGLRKHLRKYADVDLYIRGSANRHSVDSLNVNVATGVLCNAFIKRGKVEEVLEEERRALEKERKELEEERKEMERMRLKEVPMMGDLF